MSVDLMVFSKEAAPKTRAEFMAWFHALTEYAEGHSYADPAITTPELRAWLIDFVQTFPDLNGPDSTGNPANDRETDYGVGKQFVYATFSSSVANEAYETARRLAEKHQVGLFDPQGGKDDILLPENGPLNPFEKVYKQRQDMKKPWWKWWSF